MYFWPFSESTEDQVALAEGAASGILAAEPHGRAFERQGAECQRFAECPVDGSALVDDLAAALDEAAQLGMQVEILGEMGERADHAIDGGLVHRRCAGRSWRAPRSERRPIPVLRNVRCSLPPRRRPPRDSAAKPLRISRNFRGGEHAFAHQPLAVELADRRMLLDLAVEDGLRVAGIVAFVVAVAAVAEHVDDHVLLELLAVIEGDLRHADGGFGIVAVDVEDGRLHAARHVGGIGRGARFVGQRGEADLIVDDQVHGAAGAVAIELRKVERFGHHALSGKRRVAVDEQRNDALALGIAEAVLLGPHDAFDHRIDGFQMAGIGRHGNQHLAARRRSDSTPRAPR